MDFVLKQSKHLLKDMNNCSIPKTCERCDFLVDKFRSTGQRNFIEMKAVLDDILNVLKELSSENMELTSLVSIHKKFSNSDSKDFSTCSTRDEPNTFEGNSSGKDIEKFMTKTEDWLNKKQEQWPTVLNKRQEQLLKAYTLNLDLITNEKLSFCNNIAKVGKEEFIEKIKFANDFTENFIPKGGKLDFLRCLENLSENEIDLYHKKKSAFFHGDYEKFKHIFRAFNEADFVNETLDNQNVSANGSNSNTLFCSQNNANKTFSVSPDEKQIEITESSHPSDSFVRSSPVHVTVERVSCFEYAVHGIEIIKEFIANKLYLKATECFPAIELTVSAENYLSSCKLFILTHQKIISVIINNSEKQISAFQEKSYELEHKAPLNENDEHYGNYLQNFQKIMDVHKKLKEQAAPLYKISETTMNNCNEYLKERWYDKTQTMEKDYSLMKITNEGVKSSYEYMWHLRVFYEVYLSFIELVEKMEGKI